MIVCNEAVKKLGLAMEQTRVIVQGFGNVGSNAARLMSEAGYKIIGIAEVGGGLYNANGIDVEALWQHQPARTAPSTASPGRTRWLIRWSCWSPIATF